MEEASVSKATVKTEVKSEGNKNVVKINIEDQDGNATTVIVKRNLPMRKVMNAFCNSKGIDLSGFRVLIDGLSFNLEHTPAKLEMSDEDVVNIFLPTDGG